MKTRRIVGEIIIITASGILFCGIVAGYIFNEKNDEKCTWRKRTRMEYIQCMTGCKYRCNDCRQPICRK